MSQKAACATNGLQRGPDTDLPELLLLFELVDEFKKEKRREAAQGCTIGATVRYEGYFILVDPPSPGPSCEEAAARPWPCPWRWG